MKLKKLATILVLILAFSLSILLSACNESPEPSLEDKYKHVSIAKAREIALSIGDTPTSQKFTIVGTIVTVSNATYGEMTVADQTGELYVYGAMSADGVFYDSMEDKPVKGDKVVLQGVLMTYDGQPQMGAKDKKAVIVDWENVKAPVNIEDYAEKSLLQARDLEKGAKVKVDGVVAQITYANGKQPNGFILVDETSSIYVHDGDIAQQVSVGNSIQIVATKAYWILADEQKNADRFGYQGSCQLEDATLIFNDKATNDFNKSWIEEITVKQLLNTDFAQNITTKLYKTTAVVERREGAGFVNYYVNDLDGKTGGYTYTQCNGSDFDWLDEFDGQICTVYLTALNAKATASNCFYRLLPVAVQKATNFTFDEKDLPAFAIEYGIVDLIGAGVFGANPELQLPNSFSAPIISQKQVTFAYSVSDDTVGQVVTGENASTLNLLAEGTLQLTITASVEGNTASITKTIQLDPAAQIETPTVAEIIATQDGEEVTLRGVVMSSLVNRSGFYISDHTGMIAVLTTEDVCAQVKRGDEIVVKGYKVHFKKATTTKCIGQCAIVGSVTANGGTADTKLIANYYGNNQIDTSYFITDKTLGDLYALDALQDYSTNVYTVTATVVVNETAYYTNINLKADDCEKFGLYCSSAGQYSWLKQYNGQEITLNLAVCNWNDKDYYVGCVVSIVVNGETIYNQLNFAK